MEAAECYKLFLTVWKLEATCAFSVFAPSGIDIFLNGFLCWWETVNRFWKGNSVKKTLFHILILRSSALTPKLSQDQIHMKELEHDSLKERSHSKKTRSYQRIEASKLEVWTRLQLTMTTFWRKFHIFCPSGGFHLPKCVQNASIYCFLADVSVFLTLPLPSALSYFTWYNLHAHQANIKPLYKSVSMLRLKPTKCGTNFLNIIRSTINQSGWNSWHLNGNVITIELSASIEIKFKQNRHC